MSELFPSDSYLENLSGLTDSRTGVYYPVKGEGLDWYVSFVKCIYRIVKNVSLSSSLRVFRISSLYFGVKSGKYFDGSVLREYSGTESGSLTDNSTNYIYLTAAGTLTVNTTGFPDASVTRHIRLATIVTSGGSFSDDDIADYRQCNLWSVGGPVESEALSDAVSDMIPKVDITVGSESGNTIQVTIQVQDAQGNSLSERLLVHAWLSDSQFGAECTTAPNTSTSWSTGTQLEEITTDKRWTAISDASGTLVIDIEDTGSPTFYLNVEVDGRIYASSAITFA